MPGDQRPGEIGDFMQEMIPSDAPAWPLAKRYIREILTEASEPSATKTSWAEPAPRLATRKEAGRMGSAIQRRDLQTDTPLCSAFLAWMGRLFG